MLNEMRYGRLSEKSIAKFRSLAREVHYDDGVAATELYALVSITFERYLPLISGSLVVRTSKCQTERV